MQIFIILVQSFIIGQIIIKSNILVARGKGCKGQDFLLCMMSVMLNNYK